MAVDLVEVADNRINQYLHWLERTRIEDEHINEMFATEDGDNQDVNDMLATADRDKVSEFDILKYDRYMLRLATKQNKLDKIKEIVKRYKDRPDDKKLLFENLIDFQGIRNQDEGEFRSPLHIAAAHGNHNIVEFLLDNGADVDEIDSEDMTPLTFAVIKGLMADKVNSEKYIETIRLLINSGAIVNLITFPYDTSLYRDVRPDGVKLPQNGHEVIEMLKMKMDRPGETHRNTIYHILNNAHTAHMPKVIAPPERPKHDLPNKDYRTTPKVGLPDHVRKAIAAERKTRQTDDSDPSSSEDENDDLHHAADKLRTAWLRRRRRRQRKSRKPSAAQGKKQETHRKKKGKKRKSRKAKSRVKGKKSQKKSRKNTRKRH